MKKSDVLKQERHQVLKDWEALVGVAEKENRGYSEEENTKVTDYRNSLKQYDLRIENAEDLEKRQAEAAKHVAGESLLDKDGKDSETREIEAVEKRFSITRMLRATLADKPLRGAEKEAQEIAIQENEHAKVDFDTEYNGKRIFVPLSFLREQNVTGGSGQYGGALVHDAAPRVLDNFKPKLWIEQMGATMLTGLSGGNIPLPVKGTYKWSWLSESEKIKEQKTTFKGPKLSPKRAGASVAINNRLIMQSSVDVEQIVRSELAAGWEQLINTAAISGDGNTAPKGILTFDEINTSKVTTASKADYAKIVELQGLVEAENATERNLGYVLHPKLKAALKTKPKAPGISPFILSDNMLDGYKYQSTTLIPVEKDDKGVNLYPLIYGDWSQLYIGQWGAVSLLVNPYSLDLQNSIRLTMNTHADIAVAHPKAFAVNKFLTAD